MNIFSQMAGSWMRPLRSFFGAALLLGVALTANAGNLTLSSGCSGATTFTTYTINVDGNGNGNVTCVTAASASTPTSTPTCTLAASPSSLSTVGGTVTLTANCTGPAPSNYIWAVASSSPAGIPPAPAQSSNNTVTVNFPGSLPATFYTYTVTTDTVNAPASASVLVNAPPSATPAATSATISANCRVDNFQTLAGYGPGIQTFDIDPQTGWTRGRNRINQPAASVWSYKVLRSTLPIVAGATSSRFKIDGPGGYTMVVRLSSTPCDLEPESPVNYNHFTDAAGQTDYCQMYVGGSGQARTYWTPDNPNLKDVFGSPLTGNALRGVLDWNQACVLPPADPQGYVYFNTRFVDHPAGGPTAPPSTSTCIPGVEPNAPNTCSYYLFYE
jgi:hypothetical protein